MKFKLSLSKSFYDGEELPPLQKLGFKFITSDIKGVPKWYWSEYYDDDLNLPEIEIENLEALVEFIDTYGDVVINNRGGELELEIYNGYRE